ncbi:ABC-type nitrate/sulfonate/bicarbonate transport system, periplasmic component [Frankia sp. EI5c]|nr:ABC transporter substrate-binding protein [Frankia sp. EI5c]OAA26207.1 ABC-type nitrate/sulfonate/bicarbonate transport system, periplasmic component [Frankia sp. EI5c]
MATGITTGLDRRGFLRSGAGVTAGAALLALGGGGLLAACGDDNEDGESGFGTLNMRLSWIKNVEFAGAYIADQRGYYREAGFSKVNLMAGGPSATPQDTDVATGKAFIGISSPDITANAILNGAPIKIIGAQYQKNPFAIVSMAATPINGPEEMIGKKIGVQATNESVWSTFLKANDLDPSSIEKVPVEFDPLPLTTGTVDGWFSFVTNEPNLLRVKGFEVATFMLADHNYPLVSETYMVRTESIEKERDKIKAVLTADSRGWKDSLADPALGAHLAATVYGKDLGLDEAEQVLESTDQNKLILTEDTRANGLFTITDELIEENIRTLGIAGVAITAEELFDLSILNELYEAKPDLV